MSQLPEKLSQYTPILGTAKERNIVTFQKLYGPINTANPETIAGRYIPEPRNIDPSVAARFKTNQLLENYPTVEGKPKVAFGADVVFVNGTRHLKSEAVGEDLAQEVEEAVAWYCQDAFIVHWLIAFAVEAEDGLKKIAVLDVEGQFNQPLPEAEVRQAFNPQINARIPLVEAGTRGAQFRLSNSYRDESIDISQALAEQLVVDRVLPHALLESLVNDEGVEIEGWELVVVDLLLVAAQAETDSSASQI